MNEPKYAVKWIADEETGEEVVLLTQAGMDTLLATHPERIRKVYRLGEELFVKRILTSVGK